MIEDELRFRVSNLLDIIEGLEAEICELKAIQIRQENELAQWKAGVRRVHWRTSDGPVGARYRRYSDYTSLYDAQKSLGTQRPKHDVISRVTVRPKGAAE